MCDIRFITSTKGVKFLVKICLHAMLSVNIIAQQVLNESVKWCRVNKSRVFKAN